MTQKYHINDNNYRFSLFLASGLTSIMYVCVCRAVTERQIFQAARAGAKSLKDLRHELGVASECGSCASCAKQCLRDAHDEDASINGIKISFA